MITTSMAVLPASATLVNFSGTSAGGRPISATANFVYDVGLEKVTVTLTNTTANSVAASELLTGIDFSLGTLTPALDSAAGVQINMNSDGTFDNLGLNNSITWSLQPNGPPKYTLIWNPPDNDDAIIGPPNTATTYTNANASLTNGSHNPLVKEVGTFVLSVPDLVANTSLTVTAFRWNTDGGAIAVPEPGAILFGVAVCSMVGLITGGRRLKNTLFARK